MSTEWDERLACVELACSLLDDVPEHGIPEGEATGLLVLHGLAMYARDTARAAASLLAGGQTLAAGALTRVVIEHAVLAQWVATAPNERGLLFLEQTDVEMNRRFNVLLTAFSAEDLADMGLDRRGGPTKAVAHEFQTAGNLFGDTENGRQLYVAYRNLSHFIHPTGTTVARYTSPLAGGLNLTPRVQHEQDAEGTSYYLASASVLCALPYLHALGEIGPGLRLGAAARTAGLPLSLND